MTTIGSSDPRLVAAARRGQHGVRLPRHWRDVLDAQQCALLVVLHSMRSTGARHVAVGQRTIASKLGRDPEGRTDHVGRVTGRLREAGAVATTRTARGAGITRYELLAQHGDYDVIPWPLLRAVEAGECTAGVLRTYAYLAQAMGAYGRTNDTAADLAHRVGLHARTVRAHVAQLETIGVIQVATVPSTPGAWWIRRIDVESSATDTSGGEVEQAPAVITVASAAAVHTHHEAGEAPSVDLEPGDTHVGCSDADVGSYEDLAPDALTPEISLPSRSDRHLGERTNRSRHGLRPKGGVFSRPGCADVVELLVGSAWLRRGDARWLGGVLSKAVVPALESGMTPRAVAWALVDHGQDEVEEGTARHIEIARRAIAEVNLDIRLGHACRRCGQDEAVTDGLHETCPQAAPVHVRDTLAGAPTVEDPSASDTLPLGQRIELYHGLGMSAQDVARIDREAFEQMEMTA